MLEHAGAEHFGEIATLEEVIAFQSAELFARGVDGNRRHDDMHMRVVVELARVGMQDGTGADLAL